MRSYRRLVKKASSLMTYPLLSSLSCPPSTSLLPSPFPAIHLSRATFSAAGFGAGGTTVTTAATTMSRTISEQKRALRSEIRKALKTFSPAQRAREDLTIQNLVLDSPWFKSSRRLCAYVSCEGLQEVDTSKILAEVLRYADPVKEHPTLMAKELYVPRVEDKNCNMRMLKITSIQDLIANSMNILEPSPVDANGNPCEDVMFASDPVDLILLPGVAFDRHGRRLGRGGGYYDVFLKRYQNLAMENKWNQPLLVALAYSVQIMEESVIPVTPNDIPVDAVVCPSGVIPTSSAAASGCFT